MLRLLEEGEQQEACEAVLSYFAAAVLLQDSSQEMQSVTLESMDKICEELILEATAFTSTSTSKEPQRTWST